MNILLIKRGAIGDVLMATPLIRQLKQNLSHRLASGGLESCRLDILVGKSAGIALKGNTNLDNIIIVDDGFFALSGVYRLAKFLYSKRNDYDYVFILDKHWYFNCMARIFCRAKIIGFARDRISQLVLNYSVDYADIHRYNVLYYLDLLNVSKIGPVNYEDIQLDLMINDHDQQTVKQILNKYQLKNFIVVVNSGGNNGYEQTGLRMLPEDKILSLLKKLLTTHQVILLGGAVDEENYHHYCRLINNVNLFNFAGQLSLAESAYLISGAKYFYTTDCGAMHLGVMMNMRGRMTAFFGPTNPAHILAKNYVTDTAIWQDQAIYDPNYALYGNSRLSQKLYFQNLDINKL